MDVREELEKLIEDFFEFARISGVPLSRYKIGLEILYAPHHQPTRLPTGKKAIYVFSTKECCLKVGKAGPKSPPRFTSQPYNPGSALNNLAKSIINSKGLLKSKLPPTMHEEINQLSERNIKSWIENNTTRYHFFIDAELDDLVLALFEVFVQCRFKPLFEGKTA